MKTLLKNLRARIFAADMTLEEHIFNLFCLMGFFSALAVAFIRGLWFSSNLATFFYLLIVAAMLGLAFILFNRLRSRRPVIIIMLCLVLNLLFPLTFFSSGGIESGITSYFVLSLSIIFILLRGKACAIMAALNIATAMTCYYLGYTRPDLITPLRTQYIVHIDSVLAITLSGMTLCLLIKIQTHAYIKEKRKALTDAKARSDFLANISHEIRTPLNAIIGVSEMELRGLKNSEHREKLQQMHDSGVALLGIINDILDISKIEAGRFELLPEEYDFSSLALDIVNTSLIRPGKDHIDFKIDISDDIPAKLCGDELCILQIVSNILSNAFKYTDAGRVDLYISSQNGPDDTHCWLKITVCDTGRGIKSSDHKRIFSDYGKLDTDATAIEGIGLGLNICKHLVEMMDGSIDVKSELGKGSCFTVTIPQKIIDPRPIGKESACRINATPSVMDARKTASGPLLFTGAILIVDDVEINLEIARSIFTEYGLKVDTAASGEQAIDMLKDGNSCYDLIFLDNLMPGMNGAETLREIRKLDSENARSVPIIGLSALERGESNYDDFFRQLQDILPKPLELQRVEKILSKWLKK